MTEASDLSAMTLVDAEAFAVAQGWPKFRGEQAWRWVHEQGVRSVDEMTNLDLVRATSPNGTCDNGPHTATSDAQFGITVWGLDAFSSYAYPAGGNIAPINTVVIPPPK